MENSKEYYALRNLTPKPRSQFGAGDALVLVGELFNRGYANGLVAEAKKRGMQIIYATVGRREKDGTLRPLNSEELAAQPTPLINIPLEAGFDMEPASDGLTPIDRIKDLKLSEWQSAELPERLLFESRSKGQARFADAIKRFSKELEPLLPKGKNVLFAHLMAGGVPRAKIIMPLMNRSTKGTGDRFLASESFWNSSLGRLCEMSFHEVTAKTFDILVKETTWLRESLESQGLFCAYSAYGYHGTEILIDQKWTWQSYTPYLQGWAKKALEDYSREWSAKGVRTAVYNCPEILTNSSSIFQGVEIPLYPLLSALKSLAPKSPVTQSAWQKCQSLISNDSESGILEILDICSSFITTALQQKHCQFSTWPQHNSFEQLSLSLSQSERIIALHKNPKELITETLSEIVFESCGKVMIQDVASPQSPVSWINHDMVARAATSES